MRQASLFDRAKFQLPKIPQPGRGSAKGIARRDLGRTVWIYAIHQVGSNFVKIGVTQDLDNRLAAIQSANPNKLEITTALSMYPARIVGVCEGYIHDCLKEKRVRGEWFEINPACADTLIRFSLHIVAKFSNPALELEADIMTEARA